VRFIAIARLISPVPPEELPSIMERFAEWREQYREHLQSFEFFAGSPGAVMVINAPDEIVLNQVMTEYPFVNYVDIEVRPIIDGDTALAQWWQVMRRMVGDSGPAESPGEPPPPGPTPGARPPA
jgi:hypothetical protein